MIVVLVTALILAILEWLFEFKKNKLGIYLTKPAVMILLIIWLWYSVDVPNLLPDSNSSSIIWFIFGLIFCLGGDVFLMLPKRFFLPGLISFLIGHICYTLGFGVSIPASTSKITAMLIAFVLIAVAWWVYVRLKSGMNLSGQERMRIPVLIYTVVISLMLYSALMTLFNPEWALLPSIFVSVGALLFLISDIMNAWVRFVALLPNYRLWIMSTYHFAQFCITLGVSLHFSKFMR
jgi:uncharacterized membrane protein YhhN